MANVEEKGRPKYSKFDKLDTAILEAILRADFDAPEAEQMDVETIIYISNLLAERRKAPKKDVATAKAEFYEYYYPLAGEEKSIYDFDDDSLRKDITSEPKQQKNTIRSVIWLNRWRKFASAVAVVVLLLFGGTITAYALGYNPVSFIGRWNDEQFWFEPITVTTELADVVAEYAGETKLVPEWLPEGYVLDTVNVSEDVAFNVISADFVKEAADSIDELYIDYMFPVNDNNTPLYEKDTAEVEKYEMYGTKYYIMDNLSIRKIVWRNENYDCCIAGVFSLAEAKKIINSIYGE